jgi:DNA recombination protein RmuC
MPLPEIIYSIVGLLAGALLMYVVAVLGNKKSDEDPGLGEAERRALEERHSDEIRRLTDDIARITAESSELAGELSAQRQESEEKVTAIAKELSELTVQAAKVTELQTNLNEVELALAQKDTQVNRLIADLADARNSLASADTSKVRELEQVVQQKELQLSRLTSDLAEAKISLAAIHQTNEAILSAKQGEYERLLKEKDDSLARERDLLTNHVQTQLDEQRKTFAETEQALLNRLEKVTDSSLKEATQQFLEIANKSFERAAEQTVQTDQPLKPEAVEELLSPVREALDRLEKQNQLMDRRRDTAFDAIERGIQQLTSEATQLANALRKPATQGAWGETAIITILENAGLIAGENFVLQVSGEDTKKRTDVVIKLPQDRNLVIDSKVPLEAFWEGTNAATDEARAIRMKAFARMVRAHVKELGSAYYWSAYDSLPDCVIMFLPTEGAYFAALEADPSLLQEAKEAGVYLANPMTVLNMAHIAAYVLADERVHQNAQEIKNLGSELYERLRMFGEQFTNVGQSLRQSVDNYNKALSWIDRNVMPTARKMQLLGTAKAKTLQIPSHIDKSVKSFQTADLRELPVETTYEDHPTDES